jgi:uncharacterized protein YbcC (UPF0753/DUF2309 family)
VGGIGPGGAEGAQPGPAGPEARLRDAIGLAAELLPAQGPISLFIHHNTLHAFEGLPFEQAVIEAAELLGGRPFLAEERYREAIARGRVLERDLRAELAGAAGADAEAELGLGLPTRLRLRERVLLHGVRRSAGSELDWVLAETDVLRRLRPDLEGELRARLLRGHASEAEAVGALWRACQAHAQRLGPEPAPRPRTPQRHRDLLLAATGEDSDALVHPLLIRLCAAYLDQGIAYWSMPDRELGLYRAFLRLYGAPGGSRERWLVGLAAELAQEDARRSSPLASALRTLARLGVPEAEWEGFVARTLLALRGFAGMLHQLAVRPDRVPAFAPPTALEDLLAVQLLLEARALAWTARRQLGYAGPLDGLRAELARRIPAPAAPRPVERAFALFELAQILGLAEPELLALPQAAVRTLLAELAAFGEVPRRRLLHRAYERRYRVELLDALAAHASEVPLAPPARPAFQAVFCIDEREESMRRHLEEVEPACETFGAPGFFGVAMYYRGVEDARAAPLCPIVIRPRNAVEEEVAQEQREEALRRAWLRRAVGLASRAWQVGSRTLTRGTLATALLGTLAAVPLVFRVLLPRTTGRLRRHASRLVRPPARTRLLLERREELSPAIGAHAGFTPEEMAAIVGSLLEETGLARGMAELVLVVGHGSTSLNNPHESAHDCGACGGGRGGPNARAFASMANHAEVRELLAARGIAIPADTVFLGAQHDSASDAITWFDQGALPDSHRERFEVAAAAFDLARARNAHERCRRYARVPTWVPPAVALAHVEARAEDLAQVRPEYGHATNAACLIGRRSRTRGLFLDRRVFLVSYDPTADDAEGRLLERVLAAVAPVGAGINLEYYFSFVDPTVYGCGTKLPHNVTSMLGVMDGHASDLRTGLPWQMTEIHEPLRLLLVMETTPPVLRRILARSPSLSRLVRNRWVQAATLSPDSAELFVFGRGGLSRYEPESLELPVVRASEDWYRGRREWLPCARVAAGSPPREARA